MYFRWHEPPPLCDCCRPPWWLERLVWRLQRWWHRLWWGREKVRIPTTIVMPEVKSPLVGLDINGIVTVQPMTAGTEMKIEYRYKRKPWWRR